MGKSKWFVIGGLLLLAAALCIVGYNLWDNHRAAESVEQILQEMSSAEATGSAGDDAVATQSGADDATMELVIDGERYLGKLEIPSLGLVLPVMSEWSYPNLKIAPCRYSGAVASDDLIIAGHNYDAHFGKLSRLTAADEVIFTDAAGHAFSYAVSAVERLDPDDVEAMESGGWDLTLFTCTPGGAARVTVRCVRADG